MNNKVLFLSISVLLLTGCSSPEPERELEYDPVELIQYEDCLDTYVPDYCEYLKPVKK